MTINFFTYKNTNYRFPFSPNLQKIGMMNISAGREKSSPTRYSVANENQNGSSLPSMKNGTSPTIVEDTVREDWNDLVIEGLLT